MNPFKAIGRGAKKVVTAPVKVVRSTARLLKIRGRAADVLELAEQAEADPRLYRDAAWRARLITAVLRLVAVLPLPVEIRTVITQLLGANWRTTLTGLGASFGILFLSAIQNGGVTIKDAAIAAAVGVIGAVAKDAGVTGGTKPATPEAAKRVE
jgi:hypothetical protein